MRVVGDARLTHVKRAVHRNVKPDLYTPRTACAGVGLLNHPPETVRTTRQAVEKPSSAALGW